MKMSIRGHEVFASRIVLSIAVVVLGVMLAGLSGCAGTSGAGWPTVEVIPTAAPAELEAGAGTPKLVRGSDGFWYVVGVLNDEVQAGSAFMGRYSGDWPLESLPRPSLANGRVLKRYSDKVALVGLTYWFPKADLETLEVTWEVVQSEETLGKGVGVVTGQKTILQYASGGKGAPPKTVESGVNDIQINLGKEAGVQNGDVYAVLKAVGAAAAPNALQLSRRLAAVCRVHTVSENSSNCVQWSGYEGAAMGTVAIGDGFCFWSIR